MTFFLPFLVKIRPIWEWQETKNFEINHINHISNEKIKKVDFIQIKKRKTSILGISIFLNVGRGES